MGDTLTLRRQFTTRARIAAGITLVQMAWGAFTRGSGSGYGCADRWPLCEGGALQIGEYGGLLPRLEFEMIVEWMHRWIALGVIVAIAFMLRTAWKLRADTRMPLALSAASMAVVLFQAGLGAWVVISDLDRDLITVHLMNAMVLLSMLATASVRWADAPPPDGDTGIVGSRGTALVAVAGVLVGATLLLGSLTHDFHAFDGWPIPAGGVFPDIAVPKQAQHYAHRITAGLSMLLLAGLAHTFTRSAPRRQARLMHVAAGAAVVNVGIGGVHVFTAVSSAAAITAHLFLAAVVWTSLSAVAAMRIRPAAPPQGTHDVPATSERTDAVTA